MNEQIRHRHVGLRSSLVYIGIDPTEDSRRSQRGGGLSEFSAYFFSLVRDVLTSGWCIVASVQDRTTNYSPENISNEEPHEERKDFGDGANPLWSLFSKQAKTQDEARIQSLAGDMDGVLVFVRLSPYILSASNL